MHLKFVFPIALLPVLATSSCDKTGTTPTTPPASDEGGAADAATTEEATGDEQTADAIEPGAPDVAWTDKTFKQRQEFMGVYVFPKMKETFQSHDAELFKGFKCQTCHGDDMDAVKFAMPNEGIYPLSKDDPIGAAKEYDEKMTAFMVNQVVPQMAELMDATWDPDDQGPESFGCFSCHPAQ